jgi:hypothetical protein
METTIHMGTLCLGGKRSAWQALGKPKWESALQKRRNLFGRGSVSIMRRAAECGVRDAEWEWGGGEAEETPQTLAKP